VEGSCPDGRGVFLDDDLRGSVYGLYLSGGTSCPATRLWRVFPVDTAAHGNVRVRVDLKMMQFHEYSGPVNLRVYAGMPPTYDQVVVGNHVFAPGPFVENNALGGGATSVQPLGTWVSFTSDDLSPLIPAGTSALRLEFWIPGGGVYGWARLHGVRLVLDDALVPAAIVETDRVSGIAPLQVQFTGRCGAMPCVRGLWDFGDGSPAYLSAGGGSTAIGESVSFAFPKPGTYHVSFTGEDGLGAARSTVTTITVVNAAPTVEIAAMPDSGSAPLAVSLSALASDSDGTVVDYAWDLGDGASASSASLQHVYSSPGTYRVSVTVTDDKGGTATAVYVLLVT
jgi:PKD repeat protein